MLVFGDSCLHNRMTLMTKTPRTAAALRQRVLIVGGGFAGLACARALASSRADVTLVDRRNFHLFQPLLYQVASGGLSPANIAAPLRGIFRSHWNVHVLLGEVVGFDFVAREARLADGGTLPFDILVVAGGSRPHYFGADEKWEPLAPGLKTIEDATRIRCRVLEAFERAERNQHHDERAAFLTFVVIGGGPTGVELAGAIRELARDSLRREFRSIDPASARVIIVESGDRLLDSFAPDLSSAARRALERLGVEIAWGNRVVEIDANGVVTRDAAGAMQRINAHTVLWAAGVRAGELGLMLAAALGREDILDRSGRVTVDERCQVPGIDGVYVIGDLAAFSASGGRVLPGVAPVAMQQGHWVGRHLSRRIAGRRSTGTFRYRDRGSMATIGRSHAVAQFGRLQLSGRMAWLMWLLVHVLALARFENRLLVSVQWLWNYITWNRSARLITQEPEPCGSPGKSAPPMA